MPPRSGSAAALAADLLGPAGILAERLAHFVHRPEQQAMAAAVAEVIADGDTLICEAGTGTGKTFAYLVPALASGRKVIVSTGTRNLQDQLFHRDIPLIRAALAQPLRIALLKGRGNYLCRHRLETALAAPERHRPDVRDQLARVRDWATVTRSGDIAEMAIPEDAMLWPAVTSTADNCLGQDCPSFGQCHLLEARRRAQEADLVVINHHLLCADMALRDEGFGEVLPGADCFIVDEAHQLPEVAAVFFGFSVSARQLVDLARDVQLEHTREAGDAPLVPETADRLREAALALRACLGAEDRRGAWQEIESDAEALDAVRTLHERLDAMNIALDPLAGRAKGLDNCLGRTKALAGRVEALLGGAGEEQVRWFDVHGRGFRLNLTPLDVADTFRGHRERHGGTWVFTSATLAVGDSFDHFARQMGIEHCRTERWQSPFDYGRQALCYVPPDLPEPADPSYTDRVVEMACAVLTLSRGRAFLLFTSHRALRRAADQLASRIEYPLLVQGSAPRNVLIERFRGLGNAVLLGSSSFWEGVDVRGEALSCVIIDKLPFASPGDPILQARAEAIRRRGGSPFTELQLPQAVIALKQGAGRLIRDATDRGVLVICDPRIYGRRYGRAFLDSLPPMAQSRDLADVRAFFPADPAD
jgi:ATP-dependent DNA helicase DinG